METNLVIAVQLILAHLLTDFVFQPSAWVRHKKEKKAASIYLYLHSFLAGAFTLLLLQNWKFWAVALGIAVTHFFIDLWKLSQKQDNFKFFMLDQALHLFVLVIAWLYITNEFSEVLPVLLSLVSSYKFLSILSGYIIAIFPIGFIVGKATEQWQKEIQPHQEKVSLEAAGRYIGIFERILVLTFILIQNFSAIGFLIAAKSILRFSDKSEASARKQTEYVLIGTLMSFAATIILGLLINYILFQ